MGQQWKHYFLYGLERAGRLAGIRFFGQHDWYRLGAEELVHTQTGSAGSGRGLTETPVVATSFALLFLAKGRAPVLVNKLRHGPRGDWNHDPDDVRNLVARRLPRLEDPAHLAGRRPRRRLRRRPPPGPRRSSSTATRPPSSTPQAGRTSATTSSRAASSSPTPAATARSSTTASSELMKELFPEDGVQAPAPLRRPPGLAGQAPADPRRLPPLGHRARLPHRGDLLAQGPLLLLEPGRALARPTPPSSWPPRSARTSSTTPPAASSPPTSSSSARSTTSRPTRPSGGPCGSPSSGTPATGTSPRWPSPT